MYNVPIDKKWCATCKWWHGKRKVNFVGAAAPIYVTCENNWFKGNRCSAWETDRAASHSCMRWTRWEKL